MKNYLLFILLCCNAWLGAQTGTIDWVYLETGSTNGSCSSQTDCDNDIVCYGVRYTPPVTAGMTSYTFSYSGSCTAAGLDFVENTSCVLDDNSFFQDACVSNGLYRLGTSASGGATVPLTANTPIILHQVCIDLSSTASVQINVDAFTTEPYTVSLNLPGGGFSTDEPTFGGFTADDSECTGVVTCNDTPICSVDFSTAGELTFTNNVNGNLNDGTSLTEADERATAFDIYDEVNEDCSSAGGQNDLTIATRLINTFDVNGNGIIDEFGGVRHQIMQDAVGLTASLPFGINTESETSAGDVRGYEITVQFANHIGIRASQLTVSLGGMNSPGTAFESASLQFLDNSRQPYSATSYQGYYNGENDLSGNCQPTPAAEAWTNPATGAVTYAVAGIVNLTDPCMPVTGSGGSDGNLAVAAVGDAGLSPTDVVRGFVLRVYGEDVATPDLSDIGNGLNGDDGTAANRATVTNTQLVSSLLGYSVDGCVFEQIALPVTWLSFTARKQNETTLLNWSTTAEINHDRFTVEWSTNGRSFTTLGTVRRPDESNVNGQRNYVFNHSSPVNGINYYRIRQHDFDGTTSLSVLRTVNFDRSTAGKLILFPNPVNDWVNVQLADPVVATTQGTLLTGTGQLVRRFNIAANTEIHSLSTTDLPLGLYIIRIGTNAVRFIKQ